MLPRSTLAVLLPVNFSTFSRVRVVSRVRPGLAALAFATLCLPLASFGADRSLGTFKDWSAMAFGTDKDLTCMAFTQPVKSQGDYSRRGDVFVFVTHRPSDGQQNRLSVETGYTFDTQSPVTVTIDKRNFDLQADGSTAWLKEASRGSDLLKAMKAGRVMRVVGTSSKGTETTDDYSLLGFTAAIRAIDKTCR